MLSCTLVVGVMVRCSGSIVTGSTPCEIVTVESAAGAGAPEAQNANPAASARERRKFMGSGAARLPDAPAAPNFSHAGKRGTGKGRELKEVSSSLSEG